MWGTTGSIASVLGAYHMKELALRYSRFIPRVYNLALSLGFVPGKMMPSRAFCSDESQGYPIILIAKHFGTFPFNHGMVGGIVATDRHGPHAHHGQDLVIIQASHVGYDPETGEFGAYRRLQREDQCHTTNCGKIASFLSWYQEQFKFAQENVLLRERGGQREIVIDNALLHEERANGLILKLDKLVRADNGKRRATSCLSTSKVFPVAADLESHLEGFTWSENGTPIGDRLSPDLFFYRRDISTDLEGRDHLERNLLSVMPFVVTSKWPFLTAAQANTQVEFDRSFRTIVTENAYKGHRVLFISGLNVDISPSPGQVFPLTKFIPWAAYVQEVDGSHQVFPLTKFISWAAYVQEVDGSHQVWEQDELHRRLMEQSCTNNDQVDLENAIGIMESHQEISLPF